MWFDHPFYLSQADGPQVYPSTLQRDQFKLQILIDLLSKLTAAAVWFLMPEHKEYIR